MHLKMYKNPGPNNQTTSLFTMTALRLVTLFAIVIVQANAQTTQAIPKIPKDCSTVDLTVINPVVSNYANLINRIQYFKTLGKKCCITPVGDLATAAHLKVCNPSNDKALNQWINGYMLNKLQNPATVEQKIDITSGSKLKLVCKVATFLNCIFNHYKILDSATFTQYNGTAGMEIINQTNSNRGLRWFQELEYIEQEYAPAMVSEAWNKTIKCPAKKAGQFTQVYIGNVNLIQALHIHLAMSCQDPAPRTKANKCWTHEWNFYNCLDGTYYEIDAKKAGVPDWLKEVNQKDRQLLSIHLKRMRSGL